MDQSPCICLCRLSGTCFGLKFGWLREKQYNTINTAQKDKEQKADPSRSRVSTKAMEPAGGKGFAEHVSSMSQGIICSSYTLTTSPTFHIASHHDTNRHKLNDNIGEEKTKGTEEQYGLREESVVQGRRC